MKKLLVSLLFTIPFQVLIAQNVKVIPAGMNSTAKQEATDDYKPVSPVIKSDSLPENTSHGRKTVKCVPGCSSKKQCVKKASASKELPLNSEEPEAESSKK